MNLETATAETGFPRFNDALLPQFWRAQSKPRLVLRSLDASAIPVAWFEQPLGGQVALEYNSRTLATESWLREPSRPRHSYFAAEEHSGTLPGYGFAFESFDQSLNLINAWVVDSGTANYGTISGSVLCKEPQKLLFEYYLQVPSTTAYLVNSTSFKIEAFHGNRAELEVLRANAEGDWITPTPYAYDRARAIMDECPGVPVALMTTDSEGGIRMAWRRGEKQARANFGARPGLKSYIYYESPEAHNAEDLQAANLLKRLRWLNS